MFTLIAAIGKKGELGNENKLIWRIKGDLQNFKDNTMGKKILMGRKTFESLPGMLSGREILVATRHDDVENASVTIVKDLDSFIDQYKHSSEEVFICGGAEIYEKFLPHCNKMIITEIHDTAEADTFFPDFDVKEWDIKLHSFGYEKANSLRSIYYQILEYTRC